MAQTKETYLPPEVIRKLQIARWKARTDLGWLCREILGYKDVSDNNGGSCPGLHQPLIDTLQKFPIPTTEQLEKNDFYLNGKWIYTPLIPITKLEGSRRTLILDARGHLKTTVNSIAHSIQWILNYPDIAILMLMGSDSRATDVLGEMKAHFQYNQRFRDLFPDHCPKKAISDWGTMERFTTEARAKATIRKEPTVKTGSIEKGAAGYHFEVIKFSDIVDEKNISGNGLEAVRKSFNISVNLLVGPKYWMDVEGTRYHFADTYGKIVDQEMSLPKEKRQYRMFIRSIFKRKVPDGEKFTVEEGKMPFELDENGKRIPRWPERFPLEELELLENIDPWLFSCQQLNHPAMNVEGAAPFPVNSEFPKKISRSDYENHVRVAYKQICVDFASTTNERSNYTVITVGAIDQYGRLYIEEIHWGRFLANQAIDLLFDVALKHYRHLRSIRIEESEYLRGLMPTIERKLNVYHRPNGRNFNFDLIKRGTRTSKNDRIYKALQPWYSGMKMAAGKSEVSLRFLDDINKDAWARLLKEMEEFPASESDDILDTIADFLNDKDWYGRETPRGNPTQLKRNKAGLIEDGPGVNRIFQQIQRDAFDKWLKIEDPYRDEVFDNSYYAGKQYERGIL